jgi:hypothetical protein
MNHHPLSWQHVVAYLAAASISAALLVIGEPPALAAVPSFLVWLMINRKDIKEE